MEKIENLFTDNDIASVVEAVTGDIVNSAKTHSITAVHTVIFAFRRQDESYLMAVASLPDKPTTAMMERCGAALGITGTPKHAAVLVMPGNECVYTPGDHEAQENAEPEPVIVVTCRTIDGRVAGKLLPYHMEDGRLVVQPDRAVFVEDPADDLIFDWWTGYANGRLATSPDIKNRLRHSAFMRQN